MHLNGVSLTPLLPLRFGILSDGPHWLIGRLWTLPSWTLWQDASRMQQREIAAFVAALSDPASVVMTADWDTARYLHLRLQQDGYRVADFPPSQAVCARSAERFVRGARSVVHVRLHTPMVPESLALMWPRFDAVVLPCMTAMGAGPGTLLAPGRDAALFGPTPQGRALASACGIGPPGARRLVACRLDATALAALGEALREIERTAAPNPNHLSAPIDLAGAERRLAALLAR